MKINTGNGGPTKCRDLSTGAVFSFPTGAAFYMKISEDLCVKLDDGQTFDINCNKTIVYYPDAEIFIGSRA